MSTALKYLSSHFTVFYEINFYSRPQQYKKLNHILISFISGVFLYQYRNITIKLLIAKIIVINQCTSAFKYLIFAKQFIVNCLNQLVLSIFIILIHLTQFDKKTFLLELLLLVMIYILKVQLTKVSQNFKIIIFVAFKFALSNAYFKYLSQYCSIFKITYIIQVYIQLNLVSLDLSL